MPTQTKTTQLNPPILPSLPTQPNQPIRPSLPIPLIRMLPIPIRQPKHLTLAQLIPTEGQRSQKETKEKESSVVWTTTLLTMSRATTTTTTSIKQRKQTQILNLELPSLSARNSVF